MIHPMSNVRTQTRRTIDEKYNKTTTVSSPSANTRLEYNLRHLAETATTINTQGNTLLNDTDTHHESSTVAEKLPCTTDYADNASLGEVKPTLRYNDTDKTPKPGLLNTEGSSSSDENDDKADNASEKKDTGIMKNNDSTSTNKVEGVGTNKVQGNTSQTEANETTIDDDIDSTN